ncbi:DoxX family protein [Paenibacillus lutimineralis]|uniref:DoxX family protein n=1 Tax=Paenibacillus lutimineralis TaxID=2707005 RepID=A0A3S9V5Z6_9BACL|nr:DoxX family protein [Paenibacillus lutimineralis]AZS17962.1 DoxX family protein [Paenibacillus lutimineralis]
MTKNIIVSTIARVVLGILFLAHGIDKLHMGLSNVEAWFDSIGVPGVFAYAVAIIELVGGVMLIMGIFTRYVSAMFVMVLLGAIFTAKPSVGLLGNGQMAGYELDLSFIIISMYLIVAERSPLSLDYLFRRKRDA